jgi:hypothetical protein
VRDQRDPQALGESLLSHAAGARDAFGHDIPLHEVWDVHVQHLPHVPYSSNEGPIERYGDPRERGDAWVEAHS